MKSLNIVFAGTPLFTLPCLNAIHASQHNIISVYTQPDRPAGRGRKLQTSAVKDWAIKNDITYYQPINFKDPENIEILAKLKPDVLIVIAYGIILPQSVLEIPKFGCINVHASLLPKFRGASPIQQSILHGEQETGITIMQMDVGMDTGDILIQTNCPIYKTDNTSILHDRLSELAVPALLDTLNMLSEKKLKPIKQDNSLATYAPKIQKIDAKINWNQPIAMIDQMIRAYNPWPITYTQLHETSIRIYKAHITDQISSTKPGTIISIDHEGMKINTLDKVLCVDLIQLPGGKVISIAEYLNSNHKLLTKDVILE